jgi:hypothetical protein
MPTVLNPLNFIITCVAGWLNQHQQNRINYLIEENRVLREQFGNRRLRFTDDQRRGLPQEPKRSAVLHSQASALSLLPKLCWHGIES